MEIYSIVLRGRPDERGTGNYDELKEELNRTSKRGKVLGLILAVKVMIKVHPLLTYQDSQRASSERETEYSNYFGCIGAPGTRRKTDREEAGDTHWI